MLTQLKLSVAMTLFAILCTSCTGGTGSAGNLTITPGDKLTVDLSDVQALNITDYTLSLRSVMPDYSSSTVLYDLTPFLTEPGAINTENQFTFIMPKGVNTTRPLMVVVDIQALNTQLIDVAYDGDATVKPGIASTLTYTLLKSYPNKPLSAYNSTDFHGIDNLIQQKVNLMISNSESLNIATSPYNRVMRYFTNGLAFNPTFLTAIQQFGVQYTFDTIFPVGFNPDYAPEGPNGNLSNYQYASNFKVGGNPSTNPFNQLNNPSILLPGGSVPSPGTNLFVSEGNKVSVSAQAFDLDEDYIDKTMIIQYIPRKLPASVTTSAHYVSAVPEPTPEYTTLSVVDNSSGVDQYLSSTIAYNEALDLTVFTSNDADTAYRNVYYLVTDGSVLMPYLWNFQYADYNRAPQIVTSASGSIDDPSLDGTSVLTQGAPESVQYPGTTWYQHGSHCITSDAAVLTYTDPSTGQTVTKAHYQDAFSRADSPWNCVIRMTDIDVDQDPNGAADQFYFSVLMTDNNTNVTFKALNALTNLFTADPIWPVYVTPAVPTPTPGTVLYGSDCATDDGVTHYRCGRGIYQVTIDNSVVQAAETKSNSVYNYSVVINDRPPGVAGYTESQQLARTISFVAQPAFLMNYSSLGTNTGPPGATTILNNSAWNRNGQNITVYAKQDTSLGELAGQTSPASSSSSTSNCSTTTDCLSDLGLMPGGPSPAPLYSTNTLPKWTFPLGIPPAAGAPTPPPMSPYLTQPFNFANTLTADFTNPAAPIYTIHPGTFIYLGNNMINPLTDTGDAYLYAVSTYGLPQEYDSTCSLPVNNINTVQGWSQMTPDIPNQANPNPTVNGWTFEIDAVDYDNVGLAPGEASDPVYPSITTDVATQLNAAGFEFCNFQDPNPVAGYYETYQAVSGFQAVDPDHCLYWSATIPSHMQPIPVYYYSYDQGTSSTVVKKFVYHRLRMKWQPKDEGTLTNHSIPGYLQNQIWSSVLGSGIQLSGETAAKDPLDINIVTSPIQFTAKRQDMIPCLVGQLAPSASATPSVLDQPDPVLQNTIQFSIFDENQPAYYGAPKGRFESEIKLNGSRTINSAEFLKYVPYSQNCGIIDSSLPQDTSSVVPSPTPVNEPLVWYAKTGDANATPRTRLQSATNPIPNSRAGDFCMNFTYHPLTNKTGSFYDEVIVITNKANSAAVPASTPFFIDLSQTALANCTSINNSQILNLNPDQQSVVLASTCGISNSHTTGQVLWNDSNTTATVAFSVNPTLASNGGYSSSITPGNMGIDMFPSMYGATLLNGANSANFDAPNLMSFIGYAFDTFRLEMGTDPLTGNSGYLPAFTGYRNGLYADNVTPVPNWLPNNATAGDPLLSSNPFTSLPSTMNAYATDIVAPPVGPSVYQYGTVFEVVDFDYQPTSIALADITPTPTPSNSMTTYYRMKPNSYNQVQAYVRNHQTVSFPIQVVDPDAFDIMQFNLIQPPIASPNLPGNAAIPTLGGITISGNGRAGVDCTSAPNGYPNPLQLTLANLQAFKECRITWSPTSADDGVDYLYSLEIQDNFSSAAWAGGNGVDLAGIGGRYPSAIPGTAPNPSVPDDSSNVTNGPSTKSFVIELQSLETNKAPFFTTGSDYGTSIPATSLYSTSSPSTATGWQTVFSANTPNVTTAGLQPTTCASLPANPSGLQSCAVTGGQLVCTNIPATQSGFYSCTDTANALTVQNNDALQSTTPIALSQGAPNSFNIYAKDTNVTQQISPLTVAPVGSVLILDGPYAGLTYKVPSLSGLTPNGGGTATSTFTFSWQPTDSEANYLSNPGGFLIPVTIQDQSYTPAPGLPPAFTANSISSTIWIWATLSVKNTAPTAYYINPGQTNENALGGAILPIQTGMTTSYTIRIRDPDIARWTQSGVQGMSAGYVANLLAGSGFSSFFTLANDPITNSVPYLNSPGTGKPLNVVQDFILTTNTNGNNPTPTNADIGVYSGTLNATDPGSPDHGLGSNNLNNVSQSVADCTSVNGTAGPCGAFNTSFTVQVIGKPSFLVPASSGTTPSAVVYEGKNFSYPLSLSISRPTEKLQETFIGIDESTSITPIKNTGPNNTTTPGLYVNENSVLRWLAADSSVSMVGQAPRVVQLYGVSHSYCGLNITGSPAITLIRYIEATGTIETCPLSADSLANDTSSASVSLTVVNASSLSTTPPALAYAEVDRINITSPAPSNIALAVDQQYSDFYGRCGSVCSGSETNTMAGGGTATTGTVYHVNGPSAGGEIKFTSGNNISSFLYSSSSPFEIDKDYVDTAPVSAGSLSTFAYKGETLKFKATLEPPLNSSALQYQYHWYVNGCLQAAGSVVSANTNTSTPIEYDMSVGALMGGVNNDCTGEYGFLETNGTELGNLVVRLDIVNGTETLSSTSTGSTVNYFWNVSIVNTNPQILTSVGPSQDDPYALYSYAVNPENPLVLNSSYLSNSSNVDFAMPLTFAGQNYFGFTDFDPGDGLNVHVNKFDPSGYIEPTILSSASSLLLSCGSSFSFAPVWIGFQPSGSSVANATMAIAVSNDNSYSIGSNADNTYGLSSSTCFSNAFTSSQPDQSPINYGGTSTYPAGFLGFSQYTEAVNATAYYTSSSTAYDGSSGANNSYFFMDGANATTAYWNNNLPGAATDSPAGSPIVYSTQPTALSAAYANNQVRKNIMVGTNTLFQLVGATQSNQSATRGYVLASTVSEVGSTNKLGAHLLESIAFNTGNTGAGDPSPSASDCNFNGTPLDAEYVSTIDTLFVLANSTDQLGTGRLVAIKNPTSNPVCTTVNSGLTNPSVQKSIYNPNLLKMAYDTTHHVIYGILTGNDLSNEFYSYDIFSQSFVNRTVPSNISANELIYAPGTTNSPLNALYLFDNRRSGSVYPTLYKIW